MTVIRIKHILLSLSGLVFFVPILAGPLGCGAVFEKPGVEIKSIHIKKIKNTEAFFRVDIEVSNPNFVSFEIKKIECDVEVDDRRIASAVSDDKTLIPSRGTGNVSLEVHSTSADIISVLLKILKSKLSDEKKLEYKISGKIYPESLFFSSQPIVFNSKGNLLQKAGNP
jgi:LEA14-like dessication related protein